MTRNMMVIEAANQLGVSTTTVYKKLEIEELGAKLTEKFGQQTISVELLQLIKDSLKEPVSLDSVEDISTIAELTEPHDAMADSNIVDQYKSVVTTLTEQLKVKDVQIAGLQKLLENFQGLLQGK